VVDQDRKGDGVDATRTNRGRLRSDQRGATAVEYGLIAALIVLAMLAGLSTLGGGSNGMWTSLKDKIAAAG